MAGYRSVRNSSPGPNTSNGKKPSAAMGHLNYVFCLFLHALLLTAHAIIVAVGFNGHPLHLVKNEWYTESFFYVVDIGPNTFGKLYLVLLLYYTQLLALRRNLHEPQMLTAVHDQATAWLGLGSAIPVLWNQFHACISPFYVICIFLYLAALFVLGVTMPSLFSVGVVFNNEARYLNITTYLSDVGTDPQALIQAFPAVNLLPLVDWDVRTVGWQDYVIYDIPNFVGFKPIQVAATQVQVRCSAIPNVTQVGDFDSHSGTFQFHIDPRVQDVHIAPSNRGLYVLPLLLKNSTGPSTNISPPSTMIVASTVDVQDSTQERRDGVVKFTPAIVPDSCSFPSECTQISAVQILACDTNIYQDNRDVVPQMGLIGALTDTIPTSQWNDWDLPASPQYIALSLINQFGTLSPPSNTIQKYHLADGSSAGNYTFTMLETNLMDFLRFDHESVSEISLGQLEAALQNAVAAVFWRGSVRKALEQQLPLSYPAAQNQQENTPFRYAVQITFWPPIVGLAMSSLLLILAAILTRHAQPKTVDHANLDNPGVLQITWLLGKDSDTNAYRSIADRLKTKSKSSHLKDLRKAGKEIPIDGWGIV
ncbi:hypothetical protein BDW22DRAFT_1358676 [Trametopsis cervina]|nr:hypothetical protein BDW22DRAFT_1358676 [Trametopsis cervina]